MDNNPDIVLDRSVRGNGVHLCYNVRRMIVRELVDAVGYHTKSQSPRFKTCRWLTIDIHMEYTAEKSNWRNCNHKFPNTSNKSEL